MKRVFIGISVLVCLGIIFPELSPAQKTGNNKGIIPGGLMAIKGDNSEFDPNENTVTVVGNVRVIQDEFKLFSDKLVIHLGQTARQLVKAVAIGKVRLVYQNLTATGEQGILYNEEQKLELEGKAKMLQDNNTITAHRIIAFLDKEIVEGYGDPASERVITTLYSRNPEQPVESKPEQPEQTSQEEAPPVVIISDTLKHDNPARLTTFTGNVKFVQGELNTFCDKLVIHLDETGRQPEKAVATGNVRLVSNDITATGEQGIFYNEEQKLELEGKAKTWQGNNTITAHRIIVFLEKEIVEGYGDPASERVIMTIYSRNTTQPIELNPKQPEKTAKEEASPVVIVSDTLKHDNPAQLVTYTGNVVVTQNSSEIRADKMLVYLSRTEEAGDDIDRIEVLGNVRITMENTIITGENGEYIDKEQKAVIKGTAEKQAHVEDKIKKYSVYADVIEVSLDTGKYNATGNTRIELQLSGRK